MAKLHRTRRIRNERWYSVWDQIGIAYLTKEEVARLSASTVRGRERRWRVASRIVWRFPLGLKRLNIDIGLMVVLSIGLVLTMSMASAGSRAWTLLASGVMIALACWAFIDDNPLLAVARRRRAAMCDRYRRSWAADTDPIESRTRFAGAVAERRSYWERARTSHGHDYATKQFQQFDRRSRFYLYGGMSMYCAFNLLQSNMVPALASLRLPVTAIGFGMFIAAITAGRWRLNRMLRRAVGSSSEARCPDCNYALTGIPHSFDPAQIDGVHTGPARCPECGTHWPLIPPPIPGK